MGDSQYVHHHYWPGEDLVPITPQARRLGFAFPVYVTKSVWRPSIAWQQGKDTNPDKRIYELLASCWKGMGKALASEPERVMYTFKHWYWDRDRPKAKKQSKATYGARLLLDPETEEPWMLIFHPDIDGTEVIEYGEHDEDREDAGISGGPGTRDGAEVDPRVRGPEDAPERGPEGSGDELERPASRG